MPCQVLVHAIDKPDSGAQKGEPMIVRDSAEVATVPWGTLEGLPDFVIIEISDRAAHQIEPYMASKTNAFTWEVVASNASGRRYRIEVNANVAADFPAKAVGNELKDYLIANYGATLHAHDEQNKQWMEINIPNTQWSDLKSDILDKFEETIRMRRYLFAESDVDFVASRGGFYSTTLSTVGSRIIDRYPD